MTVRELLGRMDSYEISEWRAFFRLREREAKEQRTKDELAARAEANLQKMVRK